MAQKISLKLFLNGLFDLGKEFLYYLLLIVALQLFRLNVV